MPRIGLCFLLMAGLGGSGCTAQLKEPIPDKTPGPTIIHTLPPPPAYTPPPCDPNERPEKVQLRYPVELAVTRDGSTVYAKNSYCEGLNFYHKTLGSKDRQVQCDTQRREKEFFETRFFYTIKANQPVQLLTIQGKLPLACEFSDGIELDSQDNLYISDKDNSDIYKINPQQETMILHAHVPEKGSLPVRPSYPPVCDSRVTQNCPAFPFPTPLPPDASPEVSYLKGPADLYIDSDRIYYSMSESFDQQERSQINRLESDGKSTRVFIPNGNKYRFAIYQENFYWQSSLGPFWKFTIVEPFPIYTYGSPIRYREILSAEKLSKIIDPKKSEDPVTHIRTNSKGELFVNDLKHHMIWKIIPHQEVIAFAGSGQQGYKDGQGSEAQFYFPTAMTFDAADNLYVADMGNHAIRKITPDGVVTTFYKDSSLQ